jgi:hypothetical protein
VQCSMDGAGEIIYAGAAASLNFLFVSYRINNLTIYDRASRLLVSLTRSMLQQLSVKLGSASNDDSIPR